ncbi:MAG: head maturation protease, ClpP-related, partial [Bacteroidota bacterium]
MKRKPFILYANQDSGVILIYSYIDEEENNAERFRNLVQEAEKNGHKKLQVRINSGGGDVFQALAMIQTLMELDMQIEIYVDGLAASAATFFLCIPGAKVYMAKNARVMLHQGSSGAYGQSEDLKTAAELLDSLNDQIAQLYAERTGKEAKWVLDNWMKSNTNKWMTAEESKEAGFVDEVINGKVTTTAKKGNGVKAVMAHYQDELAIENQEQNSKQIFKTMKKLVALFAALLAVQYEGAPVVNVEYGADGPSEDDLKKGINQLVAKFNDVSAKNTSLQKEI